MQIFVDPKDAKNVPAGLEEKIDQPRLEIASGMLWI